MSPLLIAQGPNNNAQNTQHKFSYLERNKHLESLPDTSSQIFDWKQFAGHSFSLLGGTRLSRQTSKTSKSTASLSLAERWNDGRLEESADK